MVAVTVGLVVGFGTFVAVVEASIVAVVAVVVVAVGASFVVLVAAAAGADCSRLGAAGKKRKPGNRKEMQM